MSFISNQKKYLYKFPNIEKFVGDWELTDESLNMLSTLNKHKLFVPFEYTSKKDHVITLKKDKTCLYRHLSFLGLHFHFMKN